MIKYVVYRRSFPSAPASSPLAMTSQDKDIKAFLSSQAENASVLAIFTEKAATAPEFAKATALAQAERATVLVAGLECLPDGALAAIVDDPRLDLTVARMPELDKYQLFVYAAVAEQDRAQTKQNIREALAQSDRKLGGLREATWLRNEALQVEARKRAQELAAIILPLREQGHSLRDIAATLNDAGRLTPQGKRWQAVQIKRLFERLEL